MSRFEMDPAWVGSQFGWARLSCADLIELKTLGVVRAGRVSSRKSSKRIQAGEPTQFRHLLILLFGFFNLPVRTPMTRQSGLELGTARGIRSTISHRKGSATQTNVDG